MLLPFITTDQKKEEKRGSKTIKILLIVNKPTKQSAKQTKQCQPLQIALKRSEKS